MDTDAGELTCKEFVEVVTGYLDGALPPSALADVEAHLVGCPGCRAYLDQMRQTVRGVAALRDPAVDPSARVRLLRAFRSRARADRARPEHSPRATPSGPPTSARFRRTRSLHARHSPAQDAHGRPGPGCAARCVV